MDINSGSASVFNMGRIHYLDQVRALAMMIGILVHGCYTYSYAVQENWVVIDKTSSLGITLGFFFFHIFLNSVGEFSVGRHETLDELIDAWQLLAHFFGSVGTLT